MKRITESYVDERLRWPEHSCVHCGRKLDKSNSTQEHIPSKSLLMKPYPEELMTIASCRECNSSFSRDEEYLAALLSAVLAGSTDPKKQKNARMAKTFMRRKGLRARIEETRIEIETELGESQIIFVPELARVNRVIVKNARCHALYDLDRWLAEKPETVIAVPLQLLSQGQYEEFETAYSELGLWPELGTRMFQRMCFQFDPLQSDMFGSWVIVQSGVYRYAAVDRGVGVSVRSVINEYLATEVYWREGDDG